MKVNELFYSIQGEGRFTGTPSVFIRFAGCNLACDFCDTDHKSYKELTEDEIMQEIEKYPAKHIVITGGEPTMQLSASLIYKMHEAKKYVQIETNGTLLFRDGLESMIDWITCSPKYKEVRIQHIDELKVVYRGQDMSQYDNLSTTYEDSYYLQPCDVKDKAKNAEILNETINFIKTNSKWKLSLQTHKILNVR